MRKKKWLSCLASGVLAFGFCYVVLMICGGLYGACVWLLKNAVTAVGIEYGVVRAVIGGIAAVLAVWSVLRKEEDL